VLRFEDFLQDPAQAVRHVNDAAHGAWMRTRGAEGSAVGVLTQEALAAREVDEARVLATVQDVRETPSGEYDHSAEVHELFDEETTASVAAECREEMASFGYHMASDGVDREWTAARAARSMRESGLKA
jgi:hypothetical protein